VLCPSTVGLHAEEKLFIEALRGLNYQASRLQAEEKDVSPSLSDRDLPLPAPVAASPATISGKAKELITKGSKLFPTGSLPATVGEAALGVTREGATMAELDHATSLAMHAAARITQSMSCSPNIQAALSWMEAIRRREPSDNNNADHERSAPKLASASSQNMISEPSTDEAASADDEYLSKQTDANSTLIDSNKRRGSTDTSCASLSQPAEADSSLLAKKMRPAMEVS
jgi:hypothetical protein